MLPVPSSRPAASCGSRASRNQGGHFLRIRDRCIVAHRCRGLVERNRRGWSLLQPPVQLCEQFVIGELVEIPREEVWQSGYTYRCVGISPRRIIWNERRARCSYASRVFASRRSTAAHDLASGQSFFDDVRYGNSLHKRGRSGLS